MIRALFGGLGVLLGVTSLISLAARDQLLSNPFRWDFEKGPGLGAFLVIAGSHDLWRAYRNRKGALPTETKPTNP